MRCPGMDIRLMIMQILPTKAKYSQRYPIPDFFWFVASGGQNISVEFYPIKMDKQTKIRYIFPYHSK